MKRKAGAAPRRAAVVGFVRSDGRGGISTVSSLGSGVGDGTSLVGIMLREGSGVRVGSGVGMGNGCAGSSGAVVCAREYHTVNGRASFFSQTTCSVFPRLIARRTSSAPEDTDAGIEIRWDVDQTGSSQVA